jgi:hypothetical protein
MECEARNYTTRATLHSLVRGLGEGRAIESGDYFATLLDGM